MKKANKDEAEHSTFHSNSKAETIFVTQTLIVHSSKIVVQL